MRRTPHRARQFAHLGGAALLIATAAACNRTVVWSSPVVESTAIPPTDMKAARLITEAEPSHIAPPM